MQLDIELYGPFSYSFYPILLFLMAIIVLAVILFVKYKPKKETKIEKSAPVNVVEVKARYIKSLDELFNGVNSGSIKKRAAYNTLSRTIRSFIKEVTDIDVLKYSLAEIDKNKMPYLYDLMKEYYEPEFSIDKDSDIGISIEHARKVIREWK